MGQTFMAQAQMAAVRAFKQGMKSFPFINLALAIEHAHDNEYQVLLPDGSEIFRIVNAEKIQLMMV